MGTREAIDAACAVLGTTFPKLTGTPEEAGQVLVEWKATLAKARRKKLLDHHPDRAARGNEADRQAREAESAKINAAYAVLQEVRVRPRAPTPPPTSQGASQGSPGWAPPPVPPPPDQGFVNQILEALLRNAMAANAARGQRGPQGPCAPSGITVVPACYGIAMPTTQALGRTLVRVGGNGGGLSGRVYIGRAR